MVCKKERILSVVVGIYLLCFLFRILEYFILRTDQTVLGEAFVHKMAGIAVLVIAAKIYGIHFEELGFTRGNVLSYLGKGLLFGATVFVFAYLIEVVIMVMQGNFKTLALYVSAYSVEGNIGQRTAAVFFVICIVGNVINVIMEEGIFRGLFPRILEKKYSYMAAIVTSSFLFGVWHIVAPVRNYCDGTMSFDGLIANAVMLAVTSSLVGLKFAMMEKLTGNLYMAMGDHFVNNTIVNILHVVSGTGADEFMAVRITIAQSVSFLMILVGFLLTVKRQRTACH